MKALLCTHADTVQRLDELPGVLSALVAHCPDASTKADIRELSLVAGGLLEHLRTTLAEPEPEEAASVAVVLGVPPAATRREALHTRATRLLHKIDADAVGKGLHYLADVGKASQHVASAVVTRAGAHANAAWRGGLSNAVQTARAKGLSYLTDVGKAAQYTASAAVTRTGAYVNTARRGGPNNAVQTANAQEGQDVDALVGRALEQWYALDRLRSTAQPTAQAATTTTAEATGQPLDTTRPV
jgi:hypothetical protein